MIVVAIKRQLDCALVEMNFDLETCNHEFLHMVDYKVQFFLFKFHTFRCSPQYLNR